LIVASTSIPLSLADTFTPPYDGGDDGPDRTGTSGPVYYGDYNAATMATVPMTGSELFHPKACTDG